MTKSVSISQEASDELADQALTGKMERLLHDIGQRHFAERPKKMRRHGGGRTNTVLGFHVTHGRFVFRMHKDAGKVHDYLKEQWAMEAARSAGIPVPRVLEVASLPDGCPYMLMEHVDGVDAREVGDRLTPLREMGVLAGRLHSVRTQGFGPVFDWSSNQLSKQRRWPDYLSADFDAEARLRVLQRHRMLDDAQLDSVREAVHLASRWKKPPVLNHGDLRLKNLIVDPDNGRIRALIDWEGCISFPAPYWDLSIALHELGVDEKEAFLDGYGVRPAKLPALLPFLRMLNVLNYAHPVGAAAASKDRERLAWLRLRLAGSLDLFAARDGRALRRVG